MASRKRAEEPLSVALHVEPTDERPVDWQQIWRELLLKPRPAADTPHVAPKEGGDGGGDDEHEGS